MAVFASNEDFDDIQHQLQYVRTSLGHKVHQTEIDPGCSRRGDGWSSPFYYLYCDNCKMEIEKPWIDPDDEEKCERCPECKKDTHLCSKKERKEEIQQRIDDLLKEECIMKQETARWLLFRQKHPLNENTSLEYNENEQWTHARDGIDIEEYVINSWYIPLKMKDLKERASQLHKKYCIMEKQRKKALCEKELGNECFKAGQLQKAIAHYTNSIRHRTDFKASYLNRALMHLKLAHYDACIHDCGIVIDMIEIVNPDTKKLHCNELFKAYLRRSNALKCESKYEEAKCDLDVALGIKPTDGAAKKLLHEIKIELRRNKLREEMSHFDWDDETVLDFDKVLGLSIQFLSESMAVESSESFKFESRDSDELFRRLYVFMCRNKKYTVRFVKRDGVHFCLKYLHSKLKSLSAVSVMDKQAKLNLLLRPYSILTRCCEESVNLEEMRRKTHAKSIRMVILLTMKYFDEMEHVLAGQSMRFVSIILSTIESVRDYIALKSGSQMMDHFVKFQKHTDPLKQNTNAIRCLFEIFASLFQCPNFRRHLYFQTSPYLYKIFLHSMSIYHECIHQIEEKQSKHSKHDDFDNLEYAISVILDGLGLILDAESCLGRSGYSNDDDSRLERQTKQMVQHFIENKNIEKYMLLITGYLKRCYLRYQEAQLTQARERYLSQLVRTINVLVQISDPLYHSLGAISILYQFNIDKEMPLLMALIADGMNEPHSKIRSMVKLTKYKILAYLDHISDDAQFDAVFGASKSDKPPPMESLPYFWKWIMDVFVEPYKENQMTPKLMEEFSMNKSRCIRTLYRWSIRRKQKSFILELMIKKYFNEMVQWLSYADEQIMANVTLSICEFIKYSMRNNRSKKKYIKKALTRKRLKDCAKLMIEKHRVIQYNAMLLMANIIDYDRDLATIATVIGAARLLECYKTKQNKTKMIQ